MAITSWTSSGIDWTSPEKLKVASLASIFTAITKAIMEREYYPNGDSTFLYAPPSNIKSYCDSIDLRVSSLIGLFVNSDLTLDGLPIEDFKLWTESDILSSIGASDRIKVHELGSVAEWAHQQYQILNKLKWMYQKHQYPSVVKYRYGNSDIGYWLDDWHPLQTQAFERYDACGWVDTPSGIGLGLNGIYSASILYSGSLFIWAFSTQNQRGLFVFNMPSYVTLDVYTAALRINGFYHIDNDMISVGKLKLIERDYSPSSSLLIELPKMPSIEADVNRTYGSVIDYLAVIVKPNYRFRDW